jgi:hypothetical protein
VLPEVEGALGCLSSVVFGGLQPLPSSVRAMPFVSIYVLGFCLRLQLQKGFVVFKHLKIKI